MKKYKIFSSRYQLSKKLNYEEVPAKESMFHVDILDNRSGSWKRCAFITRKTYDDAQKEAENYINVKHK
tara:strand:+ start:205 stop:411 length:207 start_codon:yes stop_codon:yes gene_type:complete